MSQDKPDPGDRPQRRPKHLIDLDNPPRPRQGQRAGMSLTRVQQWVASSMIFIVGMGITIPLAAVTPFMKEGDGAPGAAVGLWIMSVIWGIATIVGILVVLRHRVLSPWLVLGILPAVAVLPLIF